MKAQTLLIGLAAVVGGCLQEEPKAIQYQLSVIEYSGSLVGSEEFTYDCDRLTSIISRHVTGEVGPGHLFEYQENHLIGATFFEVAPIDHYDFEYTNGLVRSIVNTSTNVGARFHYGPDNKLSRVEDIGDNGISNFTYRDGNLHEVIYTNSAMPWVRSVTKLESYDNRINPYNMLVEALDGQVAVGYYFLGLRAISKNNSAKTSIDSGNGNGSVVAVTMNYRYNENGLPEAIINEPGLTSTSTQTIHYAKKECL